MNVWIGCNTIYRTHFTKDSWAYNQIVLQKYVSLIPKKMMVECCGMPNWIIKVKLRPLEFSQDFHYERQTVREWLTFPPFSTGVLREIHNGSKKSPVSSPLWNHDLWLRQALRPNAVVTPDTPALTLDALHTHHIHTCIKLSIRSGCLASEISLYLTGSADIRRKFYHRNRYTVNSVTKYWHFTTP